MDNSSENNESHYLLVGSMVDQDKYEVLVIIGDDHLEAFLKAAVAGRLRFAEITQSMAVSRLREGNEGLVAITHLDSLDALHGALSAVSSASLPARLLSYPRVPMKAHGLKVTKVLEPRPGIPTIDNLF